ncbi:MAG: YdcF family protein [Huintestinicola sp.]|uniref:YdcF family protein n=1 Tax=Huintestinicola sp. TaxID=2981661 RepID=UPI003F022CF0
MKMISEIVKGTLPRVCLLVLGIISAGFFLLFFVSGMTAKFHTGNAAGMAVSAALAFVCLFPDTAARLVLKAAENKFGRVLLVLFFLLAAVSVILAVVISVFMARAVDRQPETPANVIVLGCRVKESGASLMLEKRIEAAYEYLSANPDVICIASGGQGSDEPVSEAECIRDGLVSRGISAHRIILEDKSVNTYENIRNSLEIIDSIGAERRAVIITSEFHQLRASMISKKQGLESYSKSSHTFLPLLPSYWVREWFAVAYEWVKAG